MLWWWFKRSENLWVVILGRSIKCRKVKSKPRINIYSSKDNFFFSQWKWLNTVNLSPGLLAGHHRNRCYFGSSVLVSISGSAGTQQQRQLVQTWEKAHFLKPMYNVCICHHDHFIFRSFQIWQWGPEKESGYSYRVQMWTGGQENGEED